METVLREPHRHTLPEHRVIGIVGGMGPHSGNALLNCITARTPAACDQEHLSVILMSFPRHISDRTLFLEGNGLVNPALSIIRVIQKLEQAGAGVVGIACNTSHSPRIFDVIVDHLAKTGSRIDLLNMPLETCLHIRESHSQVTRIGLMATNGTYRSGIYSDLLRRWGYEVVLPDETFQDSVIHRMIYDPVFGIKSNPAGIRNEVTCLLEKALGFFRSKKTDLVILGCTEFSLTEVATMAGDLRVIDSTSVMANALIREAVACRENLKYK